MKQLSLNVVVIGAGAAGNKAVINLINNNTIKPEEAILVNTTRRDIPSEFDNENEKPEIIIISNEEDGGSAKEPKIAETLTINAIKSNVLNLDTLIGTDTDLVIFIGSLEGGTGNGSIPVMAKYVRDKLGFKVHIVAIKGFGTDARGLDNSINFFKKMQANYAIECIDNGKFIDAAKNNFRKAEQLANDEIVSRIATLRGFNILPSKQNIDAKELKKIASREGFTNIEYFEIPRATKIKNIDTFNSIIKDDIIDSSKGMEVSKPSQKCMGVIINLPEEEQQYIDFNFEVIKETYGSPFEIYTHIQDVEEMPKFISFINTGMKMPINELRLFQEQFKEEFLNIDVDEDDFFTQLNSFDVTPSNVFDFDTPSATTKSDKDSFFDNLFGDDNTNNMLDDMLKENESK